MAQTYSFDIVSEVSMQETDNAVNQAIKEIGSRYDLRGSNAEVDFDPKQKTIAIRAEGEHFVEAVREIIQQKCLKRGISALSLDAGKPEAFGGKTIRMTIKIKDGLEQEEAKKITALIRDSKLKVQSQIQGNQVRITGKSKDDLQDVMNMIRSTELHFPVQFINMR